MRSLLRIRSVHWFGVVFLATLLLAACGGDDDDESSSTSGTLTVFAAASLSDAFEAIATAMEDDHPDLEIAFNFAGSQQLVTQLADGARADVFASANVAQMSAAEDAGVIASESAVFTRNRLAIVVPSDNPAGLTTPADLANDGVKIVIAHPDVPVGRYSLEMLENLAADPTAGSDFHTRVEDNIVSQESNVRQVITKVQLGEADAGIVYVSDITPDVADDVTLIEIPDAANVVAEYPMAIVDGGNAELAQLFIDFVLSDAGQTILAAWGFTPLDQ